MKLLFHTRLENLTDGKWYRKLIWLLTYVLGVCLNIKDLLSGLGRISLKQLCELFSQTLQLELWYLDLISTLSILQLPQRISYHWIYKSPKSKQMLKGQTTSMKMDQVTNAVNIPKVGSRTLHKAILVCSRSLPDQNRTIPVDHGVILLVQCR